MMMPANYSALAENEMTYVVGGATVLEGLQKLGQNAWTIIGNTFVGKLVNATLGTMFGGNYAFGHVFDALGAAVTGSGKYDALNTVMQVVGMGAAAHQLATTDVKNYTGNQKFITVTVE